MRMLVRRQSPWAVTSLLCVLLVHQNGPLSIVGAATTTRQTRSHRKPQVLGTDSYLEVMRNELSYRVYPLRTDEEAAVIEWGHSAIISAIDASVAHFGPQTSQAALLEVETMPVVANPVDGRWVDDESDEEEESNESSSDESTIIRALDNADEVVGNVVIMTNAAHLTGIQMARIAQKSGAAALLVVNFDEMRPDDIYRLDVVNEEEEELAKTIDIPVAMISLNSANVLSSATVTPEMDVSEIVNNGLPDRIRLYAGGDRPFFEDVESVDPTIYIIHNLLTAAECESLVQQSQSRVERIRKDDVLQFTEESGNYVDVDRVTLWQGMLQGPSRKPIEERIEQVTGFPAEHYSDFIVDRLGPGAHWKPHHDTLLSAPGGLPMATITIYLTDIPSGKGGELIYPSTNDDSVKILPRKGMAVVHHNLDENHKFDVNTLHALLPVTEGEFYVARKYVFAMPLSNARRAVLPVVAAPFGGKLPQPIVAFFEYLVHQFGFASGSQYFDQVCMVVPVLVLLLIAQLVTVIVRKQLASSPRGTREKRD